MSWMEWYDSLAKPSWTPAPSTISLIWAILYPIITRPLGVAMFYPGPCGVKGVAGTMPAECWNRASRKT